MHLVTVWEAGDEGTTAGLMLMGGALVVRKWIAAPELRIAHCLMVAASFIIVLMMMAAVRA